MASGANLVGFEEVLAKMEEKLGEDKVRRVSNKALREVAKEIEPDFKEAISSYRDTGATVEAIAVSGVSRASGVAQVKLGFGNGDPTRWQLVHLNELGYAHNPSPRGFGVIRRFSDSLESTYPEKVKTHLRAGFGGDL
ncbi:HK97 gp10 family phage protein [Streptococcus suis]|nr:HK97 gp10 family phage protein [Streptococcus suis]MBY5039418.1 HK97 gp10 family phage protein [Streptococcus suis]